jgi:hypothetical protein
MTHSETVKALLPALSKAISDMPDPKRNKKNDHFKNRYADLGAVLDCIAEPLQANGLVLTQTMTSDDQLVTTVWHCASGEWISSTMALRPEKATPQGMASAITYARRYAIKALFGMSDTDDDGEAASNRGRDTDRNATPPPPPTPSKTPPKSGVQPFAVAEEAIAAINSVGNKEALERVGKRIAESRFTGEDLKGVRDAWGERMAIMTEPVS